MSLRPRVVYSYYRGNVRVIGPATEPVSLAEIKAELRIEGTAEDASLTLYIATAREYIEDVTGMAIGEQEWKLTLDQWPSARDKWWDGVRQGALSEIAGPERELLLPRYPLKSVDEITVFDDGGNGQTVPVAPAFITDTQQRPGRLVLRRGAVWPIALQTANAIEIEYTCGFDPVPGPVKMAVLRMASYLYEHRGDCGGADAYTKSGASDMAGKYAVARI